jgi:hypothetical protein
MTPLHWFIVAIIAAPIAYVAFDFLRDQVRYYRQHRPNRYLPKPRYDERDSIGQFRRMNKP